MGHAERPHHQARSRSHPSFKVHVFERITRFDLNSWGCVGLNSLDAHVVRARANRLLACDRLRGSRRESNGHKRSDKNRILHRILQISGVG